MNKKLIILISILLLAPMFVSATLYNYWVEDSTHMWIKFNITSGTNLTLTIYNGTNMTGSRECGACVFPIIFDDFNDNSFNTSMWYTDKPSYSISESGGILTWTSTGTNGGNLYSVSSVYGGTWKARSQEGYHRLTSTAASSSLWGTMTTGLTQWTAAYGYYYGGGASGATLDWVNSWGAYAFNKADQYDRISMLMTYYSSAWHYDIYRTHTTSLTSRSVGGSPAYAPGICYLGTLYDNGNYNAYDWVGVRNILNATPYISCTNNVCLISSNESANDVTYVFTGTFNTAGTNYVSDSAVTSITIQTPTPSTNTLVYMTNNSFIFNTTSSGFTGSPNITQRVYYANGTLYDSKLNVSENISNTFTLNYTGVYYYNATVQNSTTNNASTETRTIEVYNLTNGSVWSPSGSYNISTIIPINYTSANSTSNRSNITYYNISLMYSNGTFNKTIAGNVSTNLSYSWNSTGTSVGTYFIKVTAYDNLSQTVNFTSSNFSIVDSCIIATLNTGLNLSNWILTPYIRRVEIANKTGNLTYYSYYINGTGIKLANQTNNSYSITFKNSTCPFTVKLLQNVSNLSNNKIFVNFTIYNTTKLLKNTTIENITLGNVTNSANLTLNFDNVFIRYYYNSTSGNYTYLNNSDYIVRLMVE